MLKLILAGALVFSATAAAWAQSPPGLSGPQISEPRRRRHGGDRHALGHQAAGPLHPGRPPLRRRARSRLVSRLRRRFRPLVGRRRPALSQVVALVQRRAPVHAHQPRGPGLPLAHPGRQHRHRCDRGRRARAGLRPPTLLALRRVFRSASPNPLLPRRRPRPQVRRRRLQEQSPLQTVAAATPPPVRRPRRQRQRLRSSILHPAAAPTALARHHDPVAAAAGRSSSTAAAAEISSSLPPASPPTPGHDGLRPPVQHAEPKRAADPLFKVANVRSDDVLNIRSGPSADFDIVGKIAARQPRHRPHQRLPRQVVSGPAPGGRGWVNSAYLVPEEPWPPRSRRRLHDGPKGPPAAFREFPEAPRACLTPAARALLERIEQKFGPVKVMSTCRAGAIIAGTGHPSRHASGNAVDFEAGAPQGRDPRMADRQPPHRRHHDLRRHGPHPHRHRPALPSHSPAAATGRAGTAPAATARKRPTRSADVSRAIVIPAKRSAEWRFILPVIPERAARIREPRATHPRGELVEPRLGACGPSFDRLRTRFSIRHSLPPTRRPSPAEGPGVRRVRGCLVGNPGAGTTRPGGAGCASLGTPSGSLRPCSGPWAPCGTRVTAFSDPVLRFKPAAALRALPSAAVRGLPLFWATTEP